MTTCIYSRDLADGLEKLLIDDKYCDFTVTAGGQDFGCHRVILAALSPYFEVMFDTPFMEGEQRRVSLEELGLDGETCSVFLKFLYTGRGHGINKENAPILLHAAHITGVKSLQDVCKNFLQKHLCKENCILVWCVARNQDDNADLAEVARSLILKHFAEIASSEDKLDGVNTVKNLIAILEAQNINVVDKAGLFCRVSVSWIDADLENRVPYIGDLCKALLQRGIGLNAIRDEAQNVRTRTKEAILHSLDDLSLGPVKEPMHFEVPADDSMIVIGGNEGGSNCGVMCFSFPQKTWYSLPPLPLDPGFNFAICAHQCNLYVSGGSGPGPNISSGQRGGKRKCLCYNGENNEWVEYPDLPAERQYHVMYAFHRSVFILGGKDGSEYRRDVYKFCHEMHKWRVSRTPLCDPVRSAAHTCVDMKVYLFGGFKSDNEKMETIQCFDCRNETSYRLWYRLPKYALLHTRAVVLDGRILLVCKDGRIVLCSEKESVREVSCIPNFERKGFGVCNFEDKILLCGGEVSFCASKDMLLYDVNQPLVIKMQESMPISASNFCFTKSRVLREYLVTECGTTIASV